MLNENILIIKYSTSVCAYSFSCCFFVGVLLSIILGAVGGLLLLLIALAVICLVIKYVHLHQFKHSRISFS